MLLQDFVGIAGGHPGSKSNMTTQLTLQTELQQESQTEYLPQLLLPYAMSWILYKYIHLVHGKILLFHDYLHNIKRFAVTNIKG